MQQAAVFLRFNFIGIRRTTIPKAPIGDIGPVSLIYDFGSTPGQKNLALDPYLGAVTFKGPVDAMALVHQEDMGDSPVDAVFKGATMDLEIPMTRPTLSQLANVMVGAVLVGNVLTISNVVGSDMYASAVPICLKPKRKGVVSVDKTEWTLIFKCAPYRAVDLKFDRSSQRVFLMKFMVFPNLDSGMTGQYYQIGTV